MIKTIGKWLLVILIAGNIFGMIFGDEEPKISENIDSKKTVKVETHEYRSNKYADLPIKQNLSYFITPQNIAGQVILRADKSPLSNYEKGVELGSGRNLREEKLQTLFNINGYRVIAVAAAEINATGFNEFEIDDFETKLKKDFAKSIPPIREAYKAIDKHIRIINLNIPVKYSKESKAVASIKIERFKKLDDSQIFPEFEYFKNIDFSKKILLSNFVKDVLNNEYIAQYIIPSKEKYNFKAIVSYNDSRYSGGFKVKGDAKILNEIGKSNKGSDTITELTLHVWDSRIASVTSHETKFVITSFKLKSSDKRFVSNNFVNLIDEIQSFGDTYYIENNNVEMYIKKDD